MAKGEKKEEKYKEILDEMSDESKNYKDNMKKRFESARDEFRIYTDKTKDNIKDKPIESVLIATGIGALVGISMAASAIGMTKMCHQDNYRSKISRARRDMKNWHSFEDDMKNNPLESLGVALGVGILLGVLMGKKDGNK